ncbi:MAG: Tol-Pal system beta propeller repeat protein TolB [Candidatus Sumerlaeia bacterium]
MVTAALGLFLVLSAAWGAGQRRAGEIVDFGTVSGSGDRPITIAVPDFLPAAGTQTHLKPGLLRDVIYKDLEVTGYFQRPRNQAFVEQQHQADLRAGAFSDARIAAAEWQRLGAEFVARGEYVVGPSQALGARAQLFDATGKLVFNLEFNGHTTGDYARLAHRIADEIVWRIKGLKGIAGSRILFVSDRTGTSEIWIMDANGDNQQPLTRLNSLALTPAWGASQTEIYYTTYKMRNPDVWGQKLTTGETWPISRFGGLNTSPNWNDRLQRLVLTLGKDGNSEIYTMTRAGQDLRRLTRNRAIDSSPVWSPDGGTIFFTSDRDGSPQIYRMNADGGDVKRLTWQGSYNDGAAVSPDGRRVAFSGRVRGVFQIFVMDTNGRNWVQLTDGPGNNQDPTWAPDSRHLAFVSARTGQKQIFIIDAETGAGLVQLTTQGRNRQPAWSPPLP